MCGRTDRAPAPLARAALEPDLPVEAFEHVACTGAKVDDVLPQLRAAQDSYPDERLNLVTVTIGGNDVGFGDVLKDCVGADDIVDRVVGRLVGCDLTEDELTSRAVGLADPLTELYRGIKDELAPRGALVVIGYPNLFADPDDWDEESCSGLSPGDARVLRRVTVAMAHSIETAAKAAGARYLPMEDLFEGHELCGKGEDWIHGFSLGVRDGTFRPQGTFHPTAAGQEAEADALAGALRDLYAVG